MTTPVPDESFHSPADPQRGPFSCNLCDRSYSRTDHLSRHYRSHTQEKPFKCSLCQKSFARADLLKRHVAKHEESTDGSSNKRQKTSRPTTTRVTQACVACAEAKLRCEESLPCRRCELKGLSCRYPSDRSKTTRPRDTLWTGPNARPEPQSMTNEDQWYGDQDSDLQSHPVAPARSFALFQPTDPIATVANDHLNDVAISAERNDPVQIPTPTTFTQATTNGSLPETEMGFNMEHLSCGDITLADFLQDVMMPTGTQSRPDTNEGLQQFMPMDILDFNMDTWLALAASNPVTDLPDLVSDGQLPAVRFDETLGTSRSGYATPVIRQGISLGAHAFQESIWTFNPSQSDNATAEQINLSLPFRELVSRTKTTVPLDPPLTELSQTARDKILALIISICDASVIPRVVSSFPSADLLTNMIGNFFHHHCTQDDTWIHYPTFLTNEKSAELLIAVIASGAAKSPIPIIRKLGYAFQEASRQANGKLFEGDNENIRKLEPLQAFCLVIDIGLWSGDRRKMEIAESFSQPLITMLRRSGHFRDPISPATPPMSSDDAVMTEKKWQKWIEEESYKRLVLHMLIRDAQSSLSLLTPCLVSYAEVTVSMPRCRDLWMAKSSAEWRDLYLASHTNDLSRLPSPRSCIEDIYSILAFQEAIDMPMSMLAILSGLWSLAWQSREWNSVFKPHTPGNRRNHVSITNSVYAEILQLFQQFKLTTSECSGTSRPTTTMLHERALMNLHVSLEDVQTLAGKAGEAEARRVFPLLAAWAQSRESRQALWHAGQVLRAAKACAPKNLQESPSVAVYHASLVFWAYSVVSRSSFAVEHVAQPRDEGAQSSSSSEMAPKTVSLDAEDNPQIQLFIVLGKGRPAVSAVGPSSVAPTDYYDQSSVFISDTKAVMTIFADLLRANAGLNGKNEARPPLIANLTRLMVSLGNAASGIKHVRTEG